MHSWQILIYIWNIVWWENYVINIKGNTQGKRIPGVWPPSSASCCPICSLVPRLSPHAQWKARRGLGTRLPHMWLLLPQTQDKDKQLLPAAIWREVCINCISFLEGYSYVTIVILHTCRLVSKRHIWISSSKTTWMALWTLSRVLYVLEHKQHQHLHLVS